MSLFNGLLSKARKGYNDWYRSIVYYCVILISYIYDNANRWYFSRLFHRKKNVKSNHSRGEVMAYVVQWVIYLCMNVMGIIIMINAPEHTKLGIILAVGGLLLFGLSLAKAHIDSFK